MWPLFPLLKRQRNSVPTLIDASYSHDRESPSTALASFTLQADGRVVTSGWALPSYANSYAWLESGAGASFDVQATATSGSVSSGTTGASWQNLGTDRTWTVSKSTTGTKSATLSLAIRPAGGGATITTKTVTLTAQVTAGGGV